MWIITVCLCLFNSRFFSCFPVWVRAYSTVLNWAMEDTVFSLLIFIRNVLIWLRMMFAVTFFQMSLIRVRKFLYISVWQSYVFNHKRMLNFIESCFASIRITHMGSTISLLLYYVKCMDYPSGKFPCTPRINLACLTFFFGFCFFLPKYTSDEHLGSICSYFVLNFCFFTHEWGWFVFFF